MKLAPPPLMAKGLIRIRLVVAVVAAVDAEGGVAVVVVINHHNVTILPIQQNVVA